ncbi:MAG TPA: NADH-quinone oxidoreductase subunit J [Gemmataceae bacterium]|jgi:NADH-quinone oxidoreductase subunit J|nr:NADH-quinone oxidoreductase subunit J [Gemmataceae bacterium]
MSLHAFLFYVVAGLTGLSAIAVVVTQNIVRSAAFLLFALAGTAGVFFLLGADFVGATQLLVYVGGVLVLVVFGVMLTAQEPFVSMKTGAAEWVVAAVVGLLLYAAIAVSVLIDPVVKPVELQKAGAQTAPTPEASRSTEVLGEAFLGLQEATPKQYKDGSPIKVTGIPPERAPKRTPMGYLLPFEIVSVHLLVVLIGAAYLARAKRRRGAST